MGILRKGKPIVDDLIHTEDTGNVAVRSLAELERLESSYKPKENSLLAKIPGVINVCH